jgi:hypothetical protein
VPISAPAALELQGVEIEYHHAPTRIIVGAIENHGTVTVAVVSGTFGRALAWINVDPVATPVTGTITLVPFAGMVAPGGTVATPGLSELRFTVKPPAGAGADRFRVSLACLIAVTVTLAGAKLSVAVTWTTTTWVKGASATLPGGVVTVAIPKFTPHTCGILLGAGWVAPSGMKTRMGFALFVMVTVEGSLLVSVMYAPLGPGGAAKVTG